MLRRAVPPMITDALVDYHSASLFSSNHPRHQAVMATPASRSASSSNGTTASKKMISYMHVAWSVGHLVVLLLTMYVFFGLAFFKGRNKSYYTAYAGALLSWSIVVYKSLGVPSLSRSYIHKAAMDENVQYLALALYWFWSKPIYLTLLPFAIFSTFHSLTFVRTTFLRSPPAAKKEGSGASAAPTTASNDWQVGLSRAIQQWVKRNYESAMSMVALIEVVVIMGRITLGALIFQNSFLHPIFYAHFLRLRYYLSPQTRHAFTLVNTQIDEWLGHPRCPPSVKNGVNVTRGLVQRYSESIISTPGRAPEAAARPVQ